MCGIRMTVYLWFETIMILFTRVWFSSVLFSSLPCTPYIQNISSIALAIYGWTHASLAPWHSYFKVKLVLRGGGIRFRPSLYASLKSAKLTRLVVSLCRNQFR